MGMPLGGGYVAVLKDDIWCWLREAGGVGVWVDAMECAASNDCMGAWER